MGFKSFSSTRGASYAARGALHVQHLLLLLSTVICMFIFCSFLLVAVHFPRPLPFAFLPLALVVQRKSRKRNRKGKRGREEKERKGKRKYREIKTEREKREKGRERERDSETEETLSDSGLLQHLHRQRRQLLNS